MVSALLSPAVAVDPQPPAANPTSRRVTNVFEDAEVRLVLREVGNAVGVSIVADSSLKGIEVSVQFSDETVEQALEKLCLGSGLVWKRKGDVYLVSTGAPDAPLFFEFAETRAYVPRVERAESLFALLARPLQAYTQVDKLSNLVTVTAPPRQLAAVLAALEVSDQPRRQFTVEALVTELSHESSAEAGFSWNWKNFAQGMESGLSYSQATSTDVAKMKALIGSKKASLLANPNIVATEGKEASITVGSETYYSMATGSAATPTIQFQRVNTGITLVVSGTVEPDGTLNLHLQPEVSDVAAPIGGSPTTTVRKADTYVRVRPGEAVALGGLTKVTETRQEQRVPILGSIPVIGEFFRSSQKARHKTEVVILIVPKLEQARQAAETPPKSPTPAVPVRSVSPPEPQPVAAPPKLMSLDLRPTPTPPEPKPSIAAQIGVVPTPTSGGEQVSLTSGLKTATPQLDGPEGTADVEIVQPPKKPTRPKKPAVRRKPPRRPTAHPAATGT